MAHALWLERSLRIGDGPSLDAATVGGVATHPDHQRQGHGSAVMRRWHQEIAGYAGVRCRQRDRSGTSGSAGRAGRRLTTGCRTSVRERRPATRAGVRRVNLRLTNPTT